MEDNKHRRLGSWDISAIAKDITNSVQPARSRLNSKDPSLKPTHRRLASKPLQSFGDDVGTTTTSKALSVILVAPCIFHTSSQPTIQEIKDDEKPEDKTEADDASSSSSSDDDDDMEADAMHPLLKVPVKVDSENSAARSVLVPDEDAIPVREDFPMTQAESQEITVAEASAVKRGKHDPNEAEINIEELLRIAFQSLLDERYLLNVPTFSRVEDKKVIQVPLIGSMRNLSEDINGKPTPWIRAEVMTLPNSLGIILERLERIGVGTIVGTVSVYKVELCRTASPYLLQPSPTREISRESKATAASKSTGEAEGADANDRGFDASMRKSEHDAAAAAEDAEKAKTERLIEDARAEWKNAATRLRIEQISEQIGEQAALTFDFLSLLIIAGILAGIGLATDNTVVIVASMLVSPIMGPVLGLTFGTQVKDWPLVKGSFVNETVALTICVVIGILMGLMVGFTNLAKENWPTNEMAIRGDPIGLVTGIAVAIPSGAGVCLSVIGGNTSSLVGVAISASLLPPAVNAGICFMHSILLKSGAVEIDDIEEDAASFAQMGAISFTLTILNIACIWVAGIAMFHVKEVSPAKNKGAFWARDLKVARELNEKGKAGEKPPPVDASVLRNGVVSAWKKKKSKDGKKPSKSVHVKIRPPRPERIARGFSEEANIDSAFAFKPKRQSFLNHAPAEGTWWRDLVETTPIEEEDAQYVNLDDLADLLGVGSDDDEEEDLPPIHWTRYGRGRYI